MGPWGRRTRHPSSAASGATKQGTHFSSSTASIPATIVSDVEQLRIVFPRQTKGGRGSIC
jgi:hypothetical protein